MATLKVTGIFLKSGGANIGDALDRIYQSLGNDGKSLGSDDVETHQTTVECGVGDISDISCTHPLRALGAKSVIKVIQRDSQRVHAVRETKGIILKNNNLSPLL